MTFLQLKIIRECIQDKMHFMLYNNPFQAFQCRVKHKQMLKTVNLLNLPAERNPAVKKKKKYKWGFYVLDVAAISLWIPGVKGWIPNSTFMMWFAVFHEYSSLKIQRSLMLRFPLQNMSMWHVKVSLIWFIPLMLI